MVMLVFLRKENPVVHTHISSKHKLFDLRLKELWQYRDLCVLFVRRLFLVRYQQTILGPAWIILNPLMTAVLHMVVFGNIAGLGTDGLPSLLFYFTGTALWSFFSACFNENSSVFVHYAGLYGKVYFPRLAIPVAHVLSGFIRLLIEMALVLLLLVFYMVRGMVMPAFGLLWVVPLAALELGLLGFGGGILISAMTAKYRDLTVLVSFGLSLLMYATPVAYPLSEMGTGLFRNVVRWNPLSAPVEMFRVALLGKGTPMWAEWGVSWIVTFLIVFFGIVVFHKVERNFLDTV